MVMGRGGGGGTQQELQGSCPDVSIDERVNERDSKRP